MNPIEKELGLPDLFYMELPAVEANYYGAAKLVANAVGVSVPANSLVYWKHGWDFTDLVDVNQVADAKLPDRRHLVHTKKTEIFLTERGFTDIKTVGMPFVYTKPDPSRQRVPGSLLVMPAHTLNDLKFSTNEWQYLEYIQSISKHFSRVVFCIGLACIHHGLWVDNLEKYGFDYVTGAGLMDQNALLRMRVLFDSFEFMTTNTMGSHVLYGAFCGVKVSLAGPYHSPSLDVYQNHAAHWDDPLIRKKNTLYIHSNQFESVKKKYPWFFTEPYQAEPCLEWAKREIGFYHKVSFAELAHLLFEKNPIEKQRYLDTLFRLDATDDVVGLCEFIQDKRYGDPDMMKLALSQFLTKVRLRAAYAVAYILHTRGEQDIFIMFAINMGIIVGYGDGDALQRYEPTVLQNLVSILSEEQQMIFYKSTVAPVIAHCMSRFINNADFQRVLQLFDLLKVTSPQMQKMVELR